MRLIVVTLWSAAAVCAQGPLQGLPPLVPNGKPAIHCGELRALTSLSLSVISAAVIPAVNAVPEHCRVSMMAQPEINIEVNLPTLWNGRLLMFGNGGWAGESFDSAGRVNSRARGLKGGFVTAATDTGHSAALERGASFALSRQKLLDFGFRSLHVTAEAAKELARTYYGTGPSKSYYEGCSQGGRQGLTLAQRFPNDFDGIVAGSPSVNQVGTHLARVYWMRGLAANPFPASKLGLLAQHVYDHCDARDGLKDGLIDDPRRCDFKPARDLPHCREGADQADCFTAKDIAALELIYGDVMIDGKRFFPGWPVGAEIAGTNGISGWIGQEIEGANGPGAWTTYGDGFLRFVMPGPRPAADVTALQLFNQFDFAKSLDRLAETREILNADDPDLSAFRRHGGKLVMYYGWADPQLNAKQGVEYYEQVTEKMGATTPEFFRLFMVPGMFHCSGGVGTSDFDAATPMVKWAEAGTAPDQIPARRIVSGKVVRSRPLCPYPQVARYSGTGSIDDAANFACLKP